MKQSKLKLFLENFLFYGGLSMLSKSIPFFTLPILTRLLKDPSVYGVSDMFNLVISFGSALGILGIYDAVFREYFEKNEDEDYKNQVTSTGLGIVCCSSICIVMFIIFFRQKISLFLFTDTKYHNMIILSAIGIGINSLNAIISSPTRMKNQRKVFLITGLMFPAIGFATTYYLVKKNYTYEALLYGTIFMNFISLSVFYVLNKEHFCLKNFNSKIVRELLKIGLPLVPTFIIYWIFNSMNRIMINKILDASELGIYSVGAKVALISQLVYTAFSGGWSYFAFSTMKDENQVRNNSMVFEYLGIISFTIFILIQPFVKVIFSTFFTGDYIRGHEVFSYLFLSPLLLMLFQVIANQMLVIKKSYLPTLSLVIGALLNILLNYYLIRINGIGGAAFSTLLSYIVSVFIMGLICVKYKMLLLEKRFIFISMGLFIGIVINFNFENKMFLIYIIYLLILFLIIVLYIKDIKYFFKNIKK